MLRIIFIVLANIPVTMLTILTQNFNLQHTLESGQMFRFHKNESTYLLQHQDKIFEIKQKKNKLYVANEKRKFIKHFFRLDEDHDRIINNINKDQIINKAINKYAGIRIIRQDPWECLIAFICSSASNIPKIKKNLELLSKSFGNHIEYNKQQFFAFPKINTLNNIQKIKAAATGYRASYIFKTNKLVSQKFFNALKKLKFQKAKQQLIQFPGIGEKIADCICLFSLNYLQAFPIDTWMKRGLQQNYFPAANLKEMASSAQTYFGPYAGYAQQYLYHYWRKTIRL